MSLTVRAAADELGITHAALLKAEKAGRVQREEDGGWNVERCRISLAQNTNTQKQRSAKAQQRKSPEKRNAANENDPEGGSTVGGKTYNEALRQKEWIRVERDRLELSKRQGELVELGPINAFVAGMILKVKDELLRLGPELRDRLSQETDPIACEEMISKRTRQILAGLAEYRA